MSRPKEWYDRFLKRRYQDVDSRIISPQFGGISFRIWDVNILRSISQDIRTLSERGRLEIDRPTPRILETLRRRSLAARRTNVGLDFVFESFPVQRRADGRSEINALYSATFD